MRLAQYSVRDEARLGVVVEDELLDLQQVYRRALARRGVPDPGRVASVVSPHDIGALLCLGGVVDAVLADVAAVLEEEGRDAVDNDGRVSLDNVAWLPAVLRPSKIFCVGANNPEMLRNTVYAPDHPIYFQKPTSCLTAHLSPIEIPDVGVVNLESELAVIIGKPASNIAAEDAYDYVFGYSILNDVTAADIRAVDVLKVELPMTDEDGNPSAEIWTATPMARHKGIDTFAPLGPWIVTKDEVPDPHSLTINSWMGNEAITSGSTSSLTYRVPQVLEWISRWSTLLPGDVVSMGTVESTADWPIRDADIAAQDQPIRIEIEGIGALANPVVHV